MTNYFNILFNLIFKSKFVGFLAQYKNNNMKNIIYVLMVVTLAVSLTGCQQTYNGQLLGVLDRPTWNGKINPYGMTYIPAGHFIIGASDQDISFSLQQRSKEISIQGFYMDDTEVTNNEYRQFTNYVRDSIAHVMLDHFEETEDGSQKIDWSYDVFWDDPEDRAALSELYYDESEQYNGISEVDTRNLVYEYDWFDWKAAASPSNRDKPRSSFIKSYVTEIYPDTLVWVRDFSYSYNEPMTRNYYWHPAFDDYPVVGVSWDQANAFSAWRTKFWNDYKKVNGETNGENFRLPFEHEWEYAARGGLNNSPYPWGGPYLRNKKGCILANFKPGRGNYAEDGGYYTVRADAYNPNDYGLYNMSGNVAEWTSSAFHENAYAFQFDMNPDIRYDSKESDAPTLKRKVLRGGSWKDIAYYLQTGTRHWEYEDTAKSYIGFRNALTFLGRSMNDF